MGGAGDEQGLRQRVWRFVEQTPSGESIPAETWRARHRNILIALVAHVPVLLAIGLYEGTESAITGASIPAIPTWLVLAELGIVLAFTAAAWWARLGRRTRTVLAAMGLMTTSGLLVQFSGGYIEAHFHFFVIMGVLAVYEDWLPFGVGLGWVVGSHVLFSMVDPSRVYNHEAAITYPVSWAVIHALFVGMLVFALMTNWQSIERSRAAVERERETLREREQQLENAEAAKAEAEATRDELASLTEELEATADAYGAAMARAADGELTVRLDPETDNEAMASVAVSFNAMMEEVEAAVGEVQTVADEVAAATERTTTGVDAARQASESARDAVDEITTVANDQRDTLEEVTGEMSTLSATVEEVASSAESVAEKSHETSEVADAGRETADRAIEETQAARTAIDATVDSVDRLEELMTEIGEIVELIGDVADQTNLLALNANVEAARADGENDGFGVVASEVKELAEETRAAATEIEQLIEATRAQTDTAVTEVETAERHVAQSASAVAELADAFEQVATNAAETDDGIREINRATDDQAASTEEAAAMVEDAAAAGRRTAEEAETAADATREQLSAVSQVGSEAASLAEQADRLRELLAQFAVERSDPAAGRQTDNADPSTALGDGGTVE